MSLLDWIYPPKCMACRQILPIQKKEWRRFRLCADCHALFEKIKSPVCGICGSPLPDDMEDIIPSAASGGDSFTDNAASERDTFTDISIDAFTDTFGDTFNNAFTDTFDDTSADAFADAFTNTAADISADTAVHGCPACFGRRFAFESNRSVFAYDGVLRDIILDIKFHNRKQSAIGLGELWASTLDTDEPAGSNVNGSNPAIISSASPFQNAILVPVPMHPRKARARGFNQAEILAAALAKKTGAEMKADLLKRVVNTPPQSGLTPKSRAENVRGVFKVNGKYKINGAKIILIDDIFTTGASLNECALILAEGGAGKITCMTLSIAVKDKT